MKRACPFHGCKRLVKPEFFSCAPHWYSLNKLEQDEIYAAYDAWKRGAIDGPTLRQRQQAVLGERGTA